MKIFQIFSTKFLRRLFFRFLLFLNKVGNFCAANGRKEGKTLEGNGITGDVTLSNFLERDAELLDIVQIKRFEKFNGQQYRPSKWQ